MKNYRRSRFKPLAVVASKSAPPVGAEEVSANSTATGASTITSANKPWAANIAPANQSLLRPMVAFAVMGGLLVATADAGRSSGRLSWRNSAIWIKFVSTPRKWREDQGPGARLQGI